MTRRSKVDLYKLPPCYNSYITHIWRVNFQVRRLKLSQVMIPEIPNPEDGHGWIRLEGRLEPHWTDGPILPDKVIDLLSNREDDTDPESSSNSDDSDSDGYSTGESGADSDFSDF